MLRLVAPLRRAAALLFSPRALAGGPTEPEPPRVSDAGAGRDASMPGRRDVASSPGGTARDADLRPGLRQPPTAVCPLQIDSGPVPLEEERAR
jgi:hypothetical protein